MTVLNTLYAKIAGAAIAALLIGGFIWHYTDLKSDLSEAQESLTEARRTIDTLEKANRAERAAVAVRDQIVTNIDKEEARGRSKTEEALGKHPGWADEPVPADILGSLRD